MLKRKYFLLVFIFGIFSSMTWAASYVLLNGKDSDFCRYYAENIDAFDKVEYFPLRCERRVHRDHLKLDKPTWTKLKPKEAFEYVKVAQKFLWANTGYEDSHYDGDEYRNRILNKLRRQVFVASVSDIDIDNDGDLEKILKFQRGNCEMEAGWWATALLVLGEDGISIDDAKTEKLLQNQFRTAKHKAGRWEFGMYDVFLYENKTYFDHWDDTRADRGILNVYLLDGAEVKHVCRVKLSPEFNY